MRDASQLAVALVDLVRFIACDHKERDAVGDFGRPYVLLVKAEIDRSLRRVIPDETVAAARDKKRNANVLSADSRVIMPTFDLVVAEVEGTLLLLTKPIIMLPCGRIEGGGNVGPSVRLFLLRHPPRRCLRFIRKHRPSPHRQKRLARSL